jgi:cell division protein ZapA
MDNRLTVNLKIDGRDYSFKSQPEEETFLREAGRLIRDRIEVHKSRGMRDPQDILTIVALESLVASLKADDQARHLQNRIYDKLAQLNHAIAPALA